MPDSLQGMIQWGTASLREGDKRMVVEDLVAEKPPIREDDEGILRVGSTRVPLERVLTLHLKGCRPETIQRKYPSLNLPDVYAVISYYLRHRETLDSYIERSQQESAAAEERIAEQFPNTDIRDRLLARRATAG